MNIRFQTLQILFLIFISIFNNGCYEPKSDLKSKTASVKKGEFIIALSERGEIKAIQEKTVVAPTVPFSLKIIELAEEGKTVSEGDVLTKFDSSEVQKMISDSEAE